VESRGRNDELFECQMMQLGMTHCVTHEWWILGTWKYFNWLLRHSVDWSRDWHTPSNV